MQSTDAVAMIQIVCQQYEGFTKCEVQDATAARKAQAMTGHPTDAQFLKMVSNNSIKNCPVKPDHITNPHSIFSPSIAGVRGQTTRQKSEQVEAVVWRTPDDFHCLHKIVILMVNVMFVNGMAFLITISQKLRLSKVEQLPSRTATQLSNSLIKIVKLYICTGFIVKDIMIDQEFDKIEDACDMVEINTTAARKHVREIERLICTIKERSQALVSDLPYNILSRQVTIYLVYFAILWLNSLLAAAGVSKKYPPPPPARLS